MAQQQTRARAVPGDWVELVHPEVEKSMRCPERAVAHWAARGWSPVAPAESEASAETAAAVKPKPAPKGATTGSES